MNAATNGRELIQSVVETLRQGEVFLEEISDGTYCRRVPVAFNAAMGGHYRHCLDHFRPVTWPASRRTGSLPRRAREAFIKGCSPLANL